LFLTRLLAGPPAALIPTQCAVCHGWGRERVCDACLQRFMPTLPRCRRCALRVPEGTALCGACVTDPPPQDGALTAMDYAHPWDQLIARFKFSDALDLAPCFARRMHEACQSSAATSLDLLLPVPLSTQRLRERGFNQSWELARRLAAHLGRKADASLLLRIKDTPHQLAFPVDRRESNVKGAFAVEPRRAGELQGKTIAVVDDVMTTGATMGEIARVLKRCGAAQVHAWTLARTPAPGE
jgi:ComF family protein